MYLNKASNESYTISEAMAIIQCKGYGEIMLGYQPIHILQILWSRAQTVLGQGPMVTKIFQFFPTFHRTHPRQIPARKVGWNLPWAGSIEGSGSPQLNVKDSKKLKHFCGP